VEILCLLSSRLTIRKWALPILSPRLRSRLNERAQWSFSRLELAASERTPKAFATTYSGERNHCRTSRLLTCWIRGKNNSGLPTATVHSRHLKAVLMGILTFCSKCIKELAHEQGILLALRFTKKNSRWGSDVVYFTIWSMTPIVVFFGCLRGKSDPSDVPLGPRHYSPPEIRRVAYSQSMHFPASGEGQRCGTAT
jgi:hypothetical protein